MTNKNKHIKLFEEYNKEDDIPFDGKIDLSYTSVWTTRVKSDNGFPVAYCEEDRLRLMKYVDQNYSFDQGIINIQINNKHGLIEIRPYFIQLKKKILTAKPKGFAGIIYTPNNSTHSIYYQIDGVMSGPAFFDDKTFNIKWTIPDSERKILLKAYYELNEKIIDENTPKKNQKLYQHVMKIQNKLEKDEVQNEVLLKSLKHFK